MSGSSRRNREKKTLEAMVKEYCQDSHGVKQGLCKDCNKLLSYAMKRIDFCRYGEKKPVCSQCPSPCYNQDIRGKIIVVMRYSGPRMMYRYPYLALRHFLDSRRKVKN